LTFKHELIELPELKSSLNFGRRLYETPVGDLYPSVTTVLGVMSDKSGIDEWRARVGEEEADRITQAAAARGTAVHAMCEDYVLNKEQNLAAKSPIYVAVYKQLEAEIKANITTIYGVETPLYTDKHRLAGRVDLIAEYKGELAIVDHKTSNSVKRKDWIQNYYHQVALYAYMLYERTGMMAKKGVIMIGVENQEVPQIIEFNIADYIKPALKIVKDYHAKY